MAYIVGNPKTKKAAKELVKGQPLLGRLVEQLDGRLADVVREARKVDLEIIMVHEVDEARGGCEFARFFQSTPQDLIEDGLYRNIAIAATITTARSSTAG